jgi:ribosome-binding protein aMBF1 (putative translation factor)
MKKNITTLADYKDQHLGKRGTKSREDYETSYEQLKVGALIHEARIEKGLTQEELAEKCGTTKSYISRIENNLKEVRISTLQRIVEVGFGGQLKLSIKL